MNREMDLRLYRITYEDFSWEPFRSEVSHYIRYSTKGVFVRDVVRYNTIPILWEKHEYAKALYLLALLDFISKEKGISLVPEYDEYRVRSMGNTMFPSGIIMLDLASKTDTEKNKMLELCKKNELSKEFLKYNIAEIMEEYDEFV